MQEGFVNYNTNNFDPISLSNQTSTVIMFGVVIDKSGSVDSYVHDMNTAAREVFMKELKNSHRKNDIVVKCVEFNHQVNHKSGFQPILNMPDDYMDITSTSGTTALYDAVAETMEAVNKYREDLEDQGIEVRTNIFIITDGEDNASSIHSADKVKKLVNDIRVNESWINSYSITMLGVGNRTSFEAACVKMGLDPNKCLVSVSASGSEIRKQMGVVSQSVSSSSASNAVTF